MPITIDRAVAQEPDRLEAAVAALGRPTRPGTCRTAARRTPARRPARASPRTSTTSGSSRGRCAAPTVTSSGMPSSTAVSAAIAASSSAADVVARGLEPCDPRGVDQVRDTAGSRTGRIARPPRSRRRPGRVRSRSRARRTPRATRTRRPSGPDDRRERVREDRRSRERHLERMPPARRAMNAASRAAGESTGASRSDDLVDV